MLARSALAAFGGGRACRRRRNVALSPALRLASLAGVVGGRRSRSALVARVRSRGLPPRLRPVGLAVAVRPVGAPRRAVDARLLVVGCPWLAFVGVAGFRFAPSRPRRSAWALRGYAVAFGERHAARATRPRLGRSWGCARFAVGKAFFLTPPPLKGGTALKHKPPTAVEQKEKRTSPINRCVRFFALTRSR